MTSTPARVRVGAVLGLIVTMTVSCSSSGGSSPGSQATSAPSPSTSASPTTGRTLIAANLQVGDLPTAKRWVRSPGIVGPSRARQVLTCLGADPAAHLVAEVSSPLFGLAVKSSTGGAIQTSSSVALLDSPVAATAEQRLFRSPKGRKCVSSVFLDTVRSRAGSAGDAAKLNMHVTPGATGGAADYSGTLQAPQPGGSVQPVAHLRVLLGAQGRSLVTLIGIGVGRSTTFPTGLFDRLAALLDDRAGSLG